MNWPLDSRPRARRSVTTLEPSDGSDTIVFDDDARRWFRLPGTAAAVWAAIDGVRTVADVVDDVAAAYAVSPDAVRSDVVAMLSDLADRSLLVTPVPR